MMIVLEILGVVLLLTVGTGMLVGNHMMEKATHDDVEASIAAATRTEAAGKSA